MFDIHHNFLVKASASKVFDAFCTTNGLDSWWTLHSAGIPENGNLYTFYFDPEHDWRAEVICVVPGEKLIWKMVKTMDDWKDTRLGFELSEREGSTKVHFFHLDWTVANEHFGVTTFCWGQLLNGLKNYVEQGVIIPHAQRN